MRAFVNWTAALLLAASACADTNRTIDGGDGDGDGRETSPICGASDVFAAAVIAPDTDCVIAPANDVLPVGLFDISEGSGLCGGRSYEASLRVHSCLAGAKDVLHIHSAEIRLMDSTRATIFFDRTRTPLPNPFLASTQGNISPRSGDEPSVSVAKVEVIPSAYREQLGAFEGEQLLAEIQMFGTTDADADVDLRPFVYAIRICDGCLRVCRSDVLGMLDEAIYGEDVCSDDSGADGRLCIDESCEAAD